MASTCVAGVIFIGTPHTWHTHRALHFCRMASLAFLNQKYIDDGYAGHVTTMCRLFEAMRVPTFSIFEGEKTKLGPWKKEVVSRAPLSHHSRLSSVVCFAFRHQSPRGPGAFGTDPY